MPGATPGPRSDLDVTAGPWSDILLLATRAATPDSRAGAHSPPPGPGLYRDIAAV